MPKEIEEPIFRWRRWRVRRYTHGLIVYQRVKRKNKQTQEEFWDDGRYSYYGTHQFDKCLDHILHSSIKPEGLQEIKELLAAYQKVVRELKQAVKGMAK